MAPSPLSILNVTIFTVILLPLLCSSRPVDTRLNNPVIRYHNGPLLTGNIKLAILFYGNFGNVHKQAITVFVKSLNTINAAPEPSVATWWRTIESYQSAAKHGGVSPRINVQIFKKVDDVSYSVGKIITQDFIATLVQKATGGDKTVLPVIFAAKDVSIVGACTGKCSSHGTVGTGRAAQPYIMVGNPEVECPETCAWPFYGAAIPLSPPSGNAGADALVLGLATALAGTVSNPYNTGFFQDPVDRPLEAVTACPAKFGSGALPGNPGKVLLDPKTRTAFNAHGVRGQNFLLPAVWNPTTKSCWTLV
ncbi:hypothetical protein NE237_030077 [Protea cynaroides]|uniref:Uncharacterized protein n=1 Tax=Protea cynaroides TaxID=273540 RepID=A0A9Q0GVG9_9MAGN|nr:hypothetical protein NE237_030077 [Protea cynaroides]